MRDFSFGCRCEVEVDSCLLVSSDVLWKKVMFVYLAEIFVIEYGREDFHLNTELRE